ncbi:MAG: YhbY family RNA-binding protein [Thermofilum sp.]|uniref:YhbY family RNA-binding protein n=1 Tax=Thermofilum pendens TaxID=2269 RepID=A0A7C4H3E8_THEPE
MSKIFQDESVVTVNIGKKGITDSLLSELDNVLRARGVVKVKLLRSYRESADLTREEVAKLLSEKLGAEVVGIRGFVIALRKPRGRRARA